MEIQEFGPVKVSRRGVMLVLSSPSGAGKTTIARRLVESDDDLLSSVSVTTRPQRPGEVSAQDYHFIRDDEFQAMAGRGDLLEYAQIFGHSYGTPRAPVMAALAAGKDLMFDIDWQGARQLTENAREDLVTVFVLPPTIEELEMRLRKRAQDSDDVIKHRMSKAPDEMSHYPEYDYVIINYDINHSVERVRAILEAERTRRVRQIGLAQFVQHLRQGVEAATKA